MKPPTIKTYTRQEIATLYGISPRTLYNWLKRRDLRISSGLISPGEVQVIFDTFGWPETIEFQEKKERKPKG